MNEGGVAPSLMKASAPALDVFRCNSNAAPEAGASASDFRPLRTGAPVSGTRFRMRREAWKARTRSVRRRARAEQTKLTCERCSFEAFCGRVNVVLRPLARRRHRDVTEDPLVITRGTQLCKPGLGWPALQKRRYRARSRCPCDLRSSQTSFSACASVVERGPVSWG